jgi:hypothetical protein
MTVWNRLPARSLVAVLTLTAVACRSDAPRLTVGSPRQSSHFARGDTVHFAADLNSDVDFGVIDPSAWRWISDIDGDLGREPRVDTPNLSVGEHHVTASVRHKLGLSRALVTVFVDSVRPTK